MTNNEDLSKNMTTVRVRKAPTKSSPTKSTVAKKTPAKPVAKPEAVDDFAVFEATPIKKEIKNPILKILDYFIGFSEPDYKNPSTEELTNMFLLFGVIAYLSVFGYIYERHQLNEFQKQQQQQQQQQEIREMLKEAEEEKRKEQFFH